jgi:hypothetical protein
MDCWMKRLARQHRIARGLYPKDDLIIVFDIDDTILDLRYMIHHVLSSFDEHHGTSYFRGVSVPDIEVGEFEIQRKLEKLGMTRPERLRVSKWFEENSWSPGVIRDAHHPFPGAIGVIGWLQAQHRTFVGLNTGRPEIMRKETLQCLNEIGRSDGVTFHDHLLFMSPRSWGEGIAESKVEGICYFREAGYRVVAFVDNEPANLEAVADFDREGEILLLHADTVYSSGRERVPENAVSGRVYDPASLAA